MAAQLGEQRVANSSYIVALNDQLGRFGIYVAPDGQHLRRSRLAVGEAQLGAGAHVANRDLDVADLVIEAALQGAQRMHGVNHDASRIR
jgi:hypothetical protein